MQRQHFLQRDFSSVEAAGIQVLLRLDQQLACQALALRMVISLQFVIAGLSASPARRRAMPASGWRRRSVRALP